MRRAWLLVVLALPAVAVAQTPPAPSAGQITFPTEVNTPIDKYINASECRSGTITLRWAIAFDAGHTVAELSSLQLYASDHATSDAVKTGDCTIADVASTGLHAGPVPTHDGVARIEGPSATDPSPTLIFDTDVIASVAGLGSCDVPDTDVMLCVQARSTSANIGTARTTLTVSTSAPTPPTNPSVLFGDKALNVEWDPSQSGNAEYYIASAFDPATSTTVNSGTVGAITGRMKTRITNLTNGVTYQVSVTAYSTADNPSTPADAGSAAPDLVNDFWDTYKNAGGREQGGCGTGAGVVGGLGLLAALSLVTLRRRR